MNNQRDMSNTTGYLELILGPMFSGKTSKLLEIYKQCSFCNIPVAVINHCVDTRYHDSLLSTHDKIMIPCIQTASIRSVWDNQDIDTFNDNSANHIKLRDAQVVLINEGQFFEDLHDCVVDMLKQNKKIYIAGLDGDFERKRFGQMLDLIPMCDKVTKLTSLCSLCKNGTFGVFSLRLSKEKQQTLVGSDNYIPVCRNCYEKNC
jgi:thymidine kinase